MLTKNLNSQFLIVKIFIKGKVYFIIPLSLFVIEYTLNMISDFIWFLGCIFKPFLKEQSQINLLVNDTLPLVIELINEMRRHGRWELVNVDLENVKISLKFY